MYLDLSNFKIFNQIKEESTKTRKNAPTHIVT